MLLVLAILAGSLVAAGPMPSPSPSPSPAPAATIIGRVAGGALAVNLVGSAPAASAGTIDQAQIAARPTLRPGDILEDIPGLVISQHSGEGKANQYYLRGFQLDHGTDLAGTVDGVPVNMPTHAHGQGYSDINWLMPELVSFVTYKKGPYYADEGDFSTAGSYDLFLRDTIEPTASFGLGSDGYERLFVAGSPPVGAGHLMYAVETYHDDGPFVNPEDYKKLNAVLHWSESSATTHFNVTASGYRGDFHSTDQIPQRLVDAGLLGRFGAVDPSDGGRTFRYVLSTGYAHQDPNGTTSFGAYGMSYGLDLFSNFTYDEFDAEDYYNVHYNPLTCSSGLATCVPGTQHVNSYVSYCPANSGTAPFSASCGDQREQEDQRFVTGLTFKRDILAGRAAAEFGAGMRNDNIYLLGLFLTRDQARFPNGTLSNDRVRERDTFAYATSTYRAGNKLRLTGGLRFDELTDDVNAFIPQNSGTARAGMLNPKFMAAYAVSPHQEVYLDFGDSFHSNDGRGTTQTVDPQTRTTFDPSGTPVQNYSPLVRAWGEEAGYRFSTAHYNATLALWKLNIASELVFDGDHGVTAPNGPTVRTGIEFTNVWSPFRAVTMFADVATSTARFVTDPNNLGTFVPESLNVVTSAGITTDRPGYSASLDFRYFGPRVLDQAGTAVSAPSSLLDFQYVFKLRRGSKLKLDIFNLLNASSDEVEYNYQSWLPTDAANPATAGLDPAYPNPCHASTSGCGVTDYHFHPSDPRQIRLTFSAFL